MPQKKEGLKDIRTSLLARGFSLAKASIKAGGLTASQWLSAEGMQRPGWLNQAEYLIQELGQLKGTAMKVGQTLSMYGEHLLPKEVNDLLKTLQQNSPPLSWEAIREVLLNELGQERLDQLAIDETPIASASIGQVYRARVKVTGEVLALKVQYPGVDLAVETDLKLLKFILNLSDLVPRGPRFDQIFTEIREMFHQEVDYTREKKFVDFFHALLKDDPRFLVPPAFAEFSTRKVLATRFVTGFRADSVEVQALAQERRNRLGASFLDLYMTELLEVQLVQTDPHLGNYLIQIDGEGADDKLVLFDFGAVREVPNEFLSKYRQLIEGGLNRDERQMEKGGRLLGLLLPEDSLELVKDYLVLCLGLIEPFALPEWGLAPKELMTEDGAYDWGGSDLPKRIAAKVSKIAFSYKLRAPPRELVFLDRKLGGVFIFLSVLKCKMEARRLMLAKLAATTAPRASSDLG